MPLMIPLVCTDWIGSPFLPLWPEDWSSEDWIPYQHGLPQSVLPKAVVSAFASAQEQPNIAHQIAQTRLQHG